MDIRLLILSFWTINRFIACISAVKSSENSFSVTRIIKRPELYWDRKYNDGEKFIKIEVGANDTSVEKGPLKSDLWPKRNRTNSFLRMDFDETFMGKEKMGFYVPKPRRGNVTRLVPSISQNDRLTVNLSNSSLNPTKHMPSSSHIDRFPDYELMNPNNPVFTPVKQSRNRDNQANHPGDATVNAPYPQLELIGNGNPPSAATKSGAVTPLDANEASDEDNPHIRITQRPSALDSTEELAYLNFP